MRAFRDLLSLTPDRFRGPVAFTLGVFDGVHLGHQKLLNTLQQWAGEDQGERVVLTFDPNPVEILAPHKRPATLTKLDHRLELLHHFGAETVIVLPFDQEWARCTAERFLQIIATSIKPHKILLGANHHFGKGREGNYAFAKLYEDRFQYECREFCLELDGAPISSSRIRKAVSGGSLSLASKLLGRPFNIRGTVIRGDQRGRTIGFPTANLELHQDLLPPDGVYAARAKILSGDEEQSLALVNIGVRPTFKKKPERLVEAHLLNFDRAIYGQDLELSFLSQIREEEKFSGIEALKTQIEKDRKTALERHSGKNFLTGV